MPFRAIKEILKADIVNLHLPQLDAAPLAILARLLGKAVVLTYHCDLLLPPGFINRLANLASDIANHLAAMSASQIITNTLDYADTSVFLANYRDKVAAIPPPAHLPRVGDKVVAAFREKYDVKTDERVIGMVGRLAAEKGAEYLVRALPQILDQHPNARVIHVGQYEDVMGEEAYAQMLAPLVAELGDRWRFLGIIPDEELAAFFQICDVVAAPSTNSTESFGIVQVEAMTCGTPTVASDMPGMRQPVLMTGMGKIFPPRDVGGLAAVINEILMKPEGFQGDIAAITKRFSPDTIAGEYLEVFEKLI
jgi:glycosyltransferase involved in cell wall biosynthesis